MSRFEKGQQRIQNSICSVLQAKGPGGSSFVGFYTKVY